MKNSIVSDAHNLPKEEIRWKESKLKANIEEENIGLKQVQKLGWEQKLTDLQLAKELAEKIQNWNLEFMKSFVLKNWNINITEEVKEWFINFWEKMWFSSNNAVTLFLKIIWEKYLSKSEIAPQWLLMLLEFLEHDIKKTLNDTGNWFFMRKWKSDENEEFDDILLKLKPDFEILKRIYPRILWEMFWQEYEVHIKKNLLIQSLSKKDEDKIIEYYKQVDSIAENNISEYEKLLSFKKETPDKSSWKINFVDSILCYVKKRFWL